MHFLNTAVLNVVWLSAWIGGDPIGSSNFSLRMDPIGSSNSSLPSDSTGSSNFSPPSDIIGSSISSLPSDSTGSSNFSEPSDPSGSSHFSLPSDPTGSSNSSLPSVAELERLKETTVLLPERVAEQVAEQVAVFNKCCPNQHVIHLGGSRRSVEPYCAELHDLDLHHLMPTIPGPRKISWEAELYQRPNCKNSTLQVIKEFELEPRDVLQSRIKSKFFTGEPQEYCVDFAIEDGSFIKRIALVCVNFDQLCANKSCMNVCCEEEDYCHVTKDVSLPEGVARPFKLTCEASLVNISVTKEEPLASVCILIHFI